ncbi:MAG: metallophosphoesterase family protein [Candidatus Bilamarchaeaceae archaeon]
MRLLIFSDLHDEEVVLGKLKQLVDRERCDYVLSCGDNSRNISFIEDIIGSFSRILIVPGNLEGKETNEFLAKNRDCIHEKRVELEKGLNIVGFGYSTITPFRTYGELSEEEIEKRVSALDIDYNTILLLHCPPRGYFDLINGRHTGSAALLKVIKEKAPLIALFGHIHETIGCCRVGKTMFVKVPPAKRHQCVVVDIRDKNILVEFLYV